MPGSPPVGPGLPSMIARGGRRHRLKGQAGSSPLWHRDVPEPAPRTRPSAPPGHRGFPVLGAAGENREVEPNGSETGGNEETRLSPACRAGYDEGVADTRRVSHA